MPPDDSDERDEREPLTVDEALAALNFDGEGYVHCFVQAPAAPGQLVLIGADWSRDEVRALFERDGAEVAGANALGMLHGIGSRRGGYFFETSFEFNETQKRRQREREIDDAG